MKRDVIEDKGSKAVPATLPLQGLAQNSTWEGPKASGRDAAFAPPPDWTRYIDSRLKQFCTR